jgi:magnesium transporter
MQFELTKEFIEELREAISQENEELVGGYISELHPADIAEIIKNLSLTDSKLLYSLLEVEVAADTLLELDEDDREKLLSDLSVEEIAETVDTMESDDAADVISELSDEQQEEVISQLEDEEQASDVVDLLAYEEDTAGGLMAKEFIKANINWPVDRCVVEMRKQAEDIETVYTIYVVDDRDILLGTLSMKSLLFATPKTKIANLYKDGVVSVKTDQDDEEVAKIMEKYDLVVLPVVNERGELLGRITIDDVVDVIKEEAEKDYQMASGISENVESSDTVWVLSRARLPWLLIGLIGGVFGAMVIGIFDIEKNIELAFFIPLIAAMGGNVGVQSSAIVVQGLANQTLQVKGLFSKLSKEFSVALINGLVCALVILGYNMATSDSLELSATVSLALFIVMIFAGLFGTLVPLVLNKYKIDPALATGPFITTANDVIGLFIYFLIGHWMYSL